MNWFKNSGSGNMVYIALCGMLLLGVLGVTIHKLSSPMMSTLYSNLSPEDSSLIISKLQSMNISFEASSDGKQLMVPSKEVFQLRMSFAQLGIPKSGSIVGYEIFDKSEPMGTSQFTHNINYVRALEGELARTISSIHNIEGARVHLVIPKKELFSKNETLPSASVIVKPFGNQVLSKDEISAISYLIANAVPGLELNKIAIVDNLGRPLKAGSGDDEEIMSISNNAAEFQNSVEKKIERELTELLERSVGLGKVKISVTAIIDFDREIINTEAFDPNSQVLRSKKVTEETDKSSNGGDGATITTNLSDAGQQGGGARNMHDKNRNDEISNYEITRTVSNKIIEGGHIKKLSIAVMVDGQYEVGDANGEVKYIPRSTEDLEKLRNLIFSAIAFDKDRGDQVEIVNMRFASEFASVPTKTTILEWLRDDLQNIIQTVVIGMVLVLVIILVLRPLTIKALEIMRERQDYERNLREATVLAQLNDAEQEAKQSVDDLSKVSEETKKVNLSAQLDDIIDQNPEDAVSVIRNWLYASAD